MCLCFDCSFQADNQLISPVSSCGAMDEPEEKIQPPGQSVQSTEGQDQKKSTQDQDGDLYLQACRQMRTVPVSSFICHLDKTDLNWNHYGVGPQGVKALAIALQSDTVITHLELEDNSLRAEGIRPLMEMLHQNTTIQTSTFSSLSNRATAWSKSWTSVTTNSVKEEENTWVIC
uniref:Uncharacterized protein n=1 Tax=Amphiprion ocellaris TaxID=80972 RepID=A0AAQ5XBP4_AMPOC